MAIQQPSSRWKPRFKELEDLCLNVYYLQSAMLVLLPSPFVLIFCGVALIVLIFPGVLFQKVWQQLGHICHDFSVGGSEIVSVSELLQNRSLAYCQEVK